MRWPWSGVALEAELRQLDTRWVEIQARHDQHVDRLEKLIEDNRQFTRECVKMMQRAAHRQEKALDHYFEKMQARTDEIVAEGRAQREALFRMLDRLPPAPGEA